MMSFKFFIAIIVTLTSIAMASFNSAGDDMKHIFMLAPFYPKLDDNSRNQYLAIAQNTQLTQDQMAEELAKWVEKQPQELQVILIF